MGPRRDYEKPYIQQTVARDRLGWHPMGVCALRVANQREALRDVDKTTLWALFTVKNRFIKLYCAPRAS